MPAPSDPTGVSIVSVGLLTGGGCVKLDWTAVTAGAHYRIQKTGWNSAHTVIVSGTVDVLVTGPDEESANLYGFASLSGGTGHWLIQIRAEDGGGNSAWVDLPYYSIGLTPTLAAHMLAPDPVVVDEITGGSARISWTEPAYTHSSSAQENREATHVIEITPDGGDAVSYVLAELESSYTVSGLQPGTDYTARVRARSASGSVFSDWSDEVDFTTTSADEVLTGPSLISTKLNSFRRVSFEFESPADVNGEITTEDPWTISGAPPGIALIAGNDPTTNAYGAPTSAGIFDATLAITVTLDGAYLTYEKAVRWLVEGGGFYPWFHDDPTRLDLQIDRRTGAVTSHAFNHPEEPVRFVRGSTTVALYLLFTDAGRLTQVSLTAVSFTIRLANRFRSPPLLQTRAVPPDAAALGDYTLQYLSLDFEQTFLNALFAGMNVSQGADALAREIECEGEISYTIGDATYTSRPFAVVIAQDYDR